MTEGRMRRNKEQRGKNETLKKTKKENVEDEAKYGRSAESTCLTM
jgi:hypothetical protein